MPGDHGLGLDDNKGLLPVRPELAEQHPEGSIAASESGMRMISLVDRELLAQGGVLQGQSCPRLENRPEETEQTK